jgi:hypothetical protein
MADEKKLGPGVTYTNPDKSTKIITVAGVLFKEGQSVNLVEKIGETRAAPILKKLAGNRYFKVDGGQDHSKQEAEATPYQPSYEGTSADNAVNEANRIREREGQEAADRYIDSLDEDGNVKGGSEPKSERRPKQGEPPKDVETPEEATLERPSRRN